MDYRTLGRSGLKVSPVCLGAMNFGNVDSGESGGEWAGFTGCDEPEAARIIGTFLDAGQNFIDTADNYNGGTSEEIVGRAVRGRRDEVVLATKAAMPTGVGPNGHGLSRAHLTRALEASLRRLGTDHIDLYQCHFPDPDTPTEETMATLDGFVTSGKVRYIGCSNFGAARIVESQWAAERIGGTPFVSLQAQYSLLCRDIEADVVDACERHGLGILTWGPLGGGVLAGRYRRDAAPDAGSRVARMRAMRVPVARAWAETMIGTRNLDVAEAVGKVAASVGATPAALALAWVAARRGVTSVVIGPRSVRQLEENLAACARELPDEMVARLEDAAGPAPRALTGASA
jgi:aryl-alcohol dehydrogenase-like predicted oxidoreductase